jgi:3-phenylpropionate/trans-cinnamate dioxygenase ferredoxin reductase subunit
MKGYVPVLNFGDDSMLDHVVVLGAGLAGLRTVEALRREGYAGPLTVIGAEQNLPYDRPPLSKQFLVDDWDEEKLSLSRQGVAHLDATWMLGERAIALDPDSLELTLSSGNRVADAGALVLATGARARELPFGQDLSGIFPLRTLDDARAIRDALTNATRVVVVGAGFIGMEVAASCRTKGLDVTVVDPLPAPLVRGLGATLGERVASRHREEGVVFHLGVGVEAFEGQGDVSGVRLSNGLVLPAEIVVVGVGAAPETDWLDGAGLDIDNGIRCDATGFTGRDNIYALGDCARWRNPHYPEAPRFEHWTSAVEQSAVVGRRIVQGKADDFAPIPYVWTDQFDLRIAIAGEIREGDEMTVCKGRIDEDRFLALFGREGLLQAAVGFKRPRELNACRKRIAESISFVQAIEEFA